MVARADAAIVRRDDLVDLDQRTGIRAEGRERTGNYTKAGEAADNQLGRALEVPLRLFLTPWHLRCLRKLIEVLVNPLGKAG